jgi:hypothetical protein
MIRNLKILIAAAMTLTAFGAVSASGAQAAEELFHCSVAPCRFRALPDGTGKTAHHVFEVHSLDTKENVSFTCNTLSGHGTAKNKTEEDVTLTEIKYNTCSVNGSPGVTVDMNGCEYTFTSKGGGVNDGANVHVLCPVGKKIEVTVPGGCTFSIAAQTPTGNGIGYHNEGVTPARTITVTANVHGIVTTASAGCSALINPNQTLEGTYTTGNTHVTGETDDGLDVMADAWFE